MERKKSKAAGVLIAIGIITILVGLVIGLFGGVREITLAIVMGVILAIIGLIIIVWIISSHNKIIRYRNKVQESLSLIDVQLKQRFDLIPNLVNVCKGYAKHEKETLEEVTKLRTMAMSTDNDKERIDYANQVLPKMSHLFGLAESYPDLKADKVFRQLMDEMIEIEDRIVAAKRLYNSNINEYNTKVEVWPSNIIARSYGFEKMELYKIETGERINVAINF